MNYLFKVELFIAFRLSSGATGLTLLYNCFFYRSIKSFTALFSNYLDSTYKLLDILLISYIIGIHAI